MGRNIEVELAVYKKLVQMFKTATTTENDVIVELIKFYEQNFLKDTELSSVNKNIPWISDGISLPEGTELRKILGSDTNYGKKGDVYTVRVQDGALVLNGKAYTTVTAVAMSITHGGVNGWRFFQCKLPGTTEYVWLEDLRKQLKSEAESKSK